MGQAGEGVASFGRCKEIKGTLHKIRTITCDNRAKSPKSNQTDTNHPSMFGAGKAKTLAFLRPRGRYRPQKPADCSFRTSQGPGRDPLKIDAIAPHDRAQCDADQYAALQIHGPLPPRKRDTHSISINRCDEQQPQADT